MEGPRITGTKTAQSFSPRGIASVGIRTPGIENTKWISGTKIEPKNNPFGREQFKNTFPRQGSISEEKPVRNFNNENFRTVWQRPDKPTESKQTKTLQVRWLPTSTETLSTKPTFKPSLDRQFKGKLEQTGTLWQSPKESKRIVKEPNKSANLEKANLENQRIIKKPTSDLPHQTKLSQIRTELQRVMQNNVDSKIATKVQTADKLLSIQAPAHIDNPGLKKLWQRTEQKAQIKNPVVEKGTVQKLKIKENLIAINSLRQPLLRNNPTIEQKYRLQQDRKKQKPSEQESGFEKFREANKSRLEWLVMTFNKLRTKNGMGKNRPVEPYEIVRMMGKQPYEQKSAFRILRSTDTPDGSLTRFLAVFAKMPKLHTNYDVYRSAEIAEKYYPAVTWIKTKGEITLNYVMEVVFGKERIAPAADTLPKK